MTNREDAHDTLGGRSAVPRYYRGIWPLSCGELNALTDLGMSAEQIAHYFGMRPEGVELVLAAIGETRARLSRDTHDRRAPSRSQMRAMRPPVPLGDRAQRA